MSNDKVRAAFESWYSGVTLNTVWFERDTKNPDEYSWQDTHIAWLAWRAALALPVEPKVELVAWRDAIIDALVIAHIYRAEHDDDPRKALHDLLAWEVSVALDPLVSADARALRDAPPAKVEPVAWMHDRPGPGHVDVIHHTVKDLWLKVGQTQNIQFMRELVPCKVEHYTTPLYDHPPALPVADSDCPRESENRDLHGQSASARELCKQLRVRLATRLREAEIEAHEWELVSGANYRDTIVLRADLAAMTKERDKAVRMFKAAVTGQDSQDRWLPCIEHRFKVDYRVSGCPQCQIEKAIAQAEASAKDAARWKRTEMEARRAGVDMDKARTEIDAAIARGAA